MSAAIKATRFLSVEVSRVCLGFVFFYLCLELWLRAAFRPTYCAVRAVPMRASLDASVTKQHDMYVEMGLSCTRSIDLIDDAEMSSRSHLHLLVIQHCPRLIVPVLSAGLQHGSSAADPTNPWSFLHGGTLLSSLPRQQR